MPFGTKGFALVTEESETYTTCERAAEAKLIESLQFSTHRRQLPMLIVTIHLPLCSQRTLSSISARAVRLGIIRSSAFDVLIRRSHVSVISFVMS